MINDKGVTAAAEIIAGACYAVLRDCKIDLKAFANGAVRWHDNGGTNRRFARSLWIEQEEDLIATAIEVVATIDDGERLHPKDIRVERPRGLEIIDVENGFQDA